MSLSFADSLKKSSTNNTKTVATPVIESVDTVAVASVEDTSVDSPSIMTLDESYGIAAYSGDDGNWTQHNGYVYYSSFSDDKISIITDTKDINLDSNQFNITQEENSQYIPFEMPRYYDGYDLVNATISIHYTTKSGRHGGSKPINVTFNDEKIRFAWLVDAGATIDAGALEFEIHAYGTVTGSDGISKAYTWKTKPNKKLNVLESLCDCEDTINNIDDSWLQELVTDIAEQVAEEIKNVAVGEQVVAAENAATRAEIAANNAEQTVSNALNGYATEEYVQTEIGKVDVSEQLQDYATIEYVGEQVQTLEEQIQSIDITEQLDDYALKTDVSTLYLILSALVSAITLFLSSSAFI